MAEVRRTLRKVGRVSLRVLAWSLIGLLGLGVLVLVCANLSPVREFARGRANQALASTFTGTLVVDRIGSIQPFAVGGVDLHVKDARGQRVLSVKGLYVESSWPRIVGDLVRGRPLVITLSPIRCDHVEVKIIDDGSGSPTLATAFSPRKPSPPATTPSTTTLAIPEIRVAHLWAHGGLPSLPVIDVEARRLDVSLVNRPEVLELALRRLELVTRAMPAKSDPSGALSARLELPTDKRKQPRGALDFAGKILDSAAKLHATLELNRVQGRFEMPALKSELLRAQFPSLALTGDTALDAQVHGDLPKLEFELSVDNAALKLSARGGAQLEDTKRVSLLLDLTRADLSRLSSGAPASDLNLRLTGNLAIDPRSALSGEYRLKLTRGVVAGVVAPNAETFGVLTRNSDGRLSVNGNFLFDEPGVTGVANYELRTSARGQSSLQASLSARLEDPARAKTLLGVRARGTVSAETTLDLNDQTVRARTQIALRDVAAPSLRAGEFSLRASAEGALRSPELDVAIRARNLELDARRFARARIDARGTPERLRVGARLDRDDDSSIRLDTVVSAQDATELSDLALRVQSESGELAARVANVNVRSGVVRFRDFRLSGAGALAASGMVGNGRADLTFEMQDLDLAQVTRVLELASPLQRGFLSGQGRVSGSLRNLRGQLDAHARELTFENVRGGSVDLSLSLGERVLSGKVEANLGRSQFAAAIEDLTIPTLPATRAALLRTRGKVTVNGNLELDRLEPALRAFGVPLEQARGELLVDLEVENIGSEARGPIASVRLKSRGLKLVEQRPKSDNVDTAAGARETEPKAIEGLDVELELNVDSAAREARVKGALSDRQGVLTRVSAETKLADLAAPDLAEAFRDQPMKLEVSLPERALEQWPPFIRSRALRGRLKADLSAEGTLADPRLSAAIEVKRLKSRKDQRGVDGQLQIRSARQGGEISGTAQAEGRRVAEVSSKWSGDLTALARESQGASLPVLLDADLKFTQFPLGIVPELSDRAIHGPLDAELRLRNFGRDARVEATVDGRGLRVGDRKLDQLELTVQADGRALSAKLAAAQQQGTLQLDVGMPMRWGARLVPVVDPHAKARLSARQFQISTLSPILLQYVSEIEGKLDADFNVELTDAAPRVQGKAKLRGGVVQIPQVGQRFSDVAADVAVADGDITLDSFEARGISGRLTAKARATLRGTDLQSVKGTLQIKKDEKLPITYEGVAMGDAWGRIELAYKGGQGDTEIRVDVPDFHVQMPDAPMASVQDLAPDEHVKVGVYRDDGKFAAVPIQPLVSASKQDAEDPVRTRVLVHLGEIWIERAQQAKVQLGGDLTITSGIEPRVDGQITLRGGKLDVNGKTFDIERGTVAFAGTDTSDPTITATARWDSPAGYTVYADYSGTVKAGKLTLHAEPQLTQTEIVSLLLFGTPEGSLGANDNGGGAAATAVGVAGDTATKGFNRVMSDFTNLDVSARIDTSTGSARPELVVQVTPRLTTRVTRALGEPSPGQSPDRTFLTMELRLRRAWALSAVVGDRGASSLDLIWRKRY